MAATVLTVVVESNVRARVTHASRDALKLLDNALAEMQKGAEWSPSHRRFGGRWDGKKHHFFISPNDDGSGSFPKGLVPRVKKLLKLNKVKFKVRDLRERLPAVDLSTVHADMLEGVSMSGMYSYQLECVKTCLRAEAGIIFAATNAGKSEIASAMIKALEDRTVLFVVPRAILLKQTRERIAERLGTIVENIGVIGGGKFDPKEITVAIVNSITPAKRAKSARAKKRNAIIRQYLATVQVLFLDEAHHAKAASWHRLVQATANAQWRYLMSGTPFTGDNDLMIEAAAGPVIYEMRNEELINLGVSAKPHVRMIEITKPDLEKEASDGDLQDESYDAIYKAGIVSNAYRNRIIAKEAVRYAKAGKTVLILIRLLQQGSDIRTLIARENVKVEFAHGKLPANERDRLTEWFVAKPGRVLVGSTIYDEGVNLPAINALIVGDGGKSLRAVLQKVGRSIRRKKTGENKVDVVDFADATHRYLASHSLERMDIYVAESFEITEESPNAVLAVANENTEADGEGFANAKGADDTAGDQAARGKNVQPLPRKNSGRREGHVERNVHARTVTGPIAKSADVFPQSSDYGLWRWRVATRLG